MLCSYGCGKEALHQFKNGKYCCSKSIMKCSANVKKNIQNRLPNKFGQKFAQKIINIMNLECDYGCGNKAEYQLKIGRYCCSNFTSKCPEVRKKNKRTNLGHPARNKGLPAWSRGLTKETDIRIKKASEKKSISQRGKLRPKHTEETKRKLSIAAKRNGFGSGFHSKKYLYNGIYLDSSYEVKVAQCLDENNINWERPSGIPWMDKDGIDHKYYADFYLPEFGIYLDPKNEYLIKKDKDKINRVIEQNSVKIFILNKNQLTWNEIKEIISNTEIVA